MRAWEKMKAPLLCVSGGGKGRGHLGFPVGLEGGQGNVEEWRHEVLAVSSAKIKDGGSHRNTKFLDIFCRLLSDHFHLRVYFLHAGFIETVSGNAD